MKDKERLLDKKSMNLKFEKMTQKKNMQEKGITLISLVLTIILLLILATVTINLAIGHNGIFSRAQEAKTKYEKESLLEEMRLAMLDKKLEKGIDLTNEDVKDALEKFGEVQQKEDGTVTGVKPKGRDDVITFEEIENGETSSGGGSTEGDEGSTGPNSGITNAEIAALREEIADLTDTANANTASITSLEAQIQSLQESLAASGKTDERVAGLQSQLAELKSQVESQKSETEIKLSSIETRLDKAEKEVNASSISDLREKYDGLNSSLDALTAKVTELEDTGFNITRIWSVGDRSISAGQAYTIDLPDKCVYHLYCSVVSSLGNATEITVTDTYTAWSRTVTRQWGGVGG